MSAALHDVESQLGIDVSGSPSRTRLDDVSSSRQFQSLVMRNPMDVEDLSVPRHPSLVSPVLTDTSYSYDSEWLSPAYQPSLFSQAPMNPYPNHVGTSRITASPSLMMGSGQEYGIVDDYENSVYPTSPRLVHPDQIPENFSLHPSFQYLAQVPRLRRVILDFHDLAEDVQGAHRDAFSNFNNHMLRTNARGRRTVFVVSGGSLVPEMEF